MAATGCIVSAVLKEKLENSRVLVVGAGGIGCELLKNLVLTGFQNIEIIDLDTIDVSNLNRQFLFQKQHVGKSKSAVAKETALTFNPDVNITNYHDSIMKPEFGVTFFNKFDLVMDALDNKAARSHVNRMCLASETPLIESGSAGYLGQVTVIKKEKFECYDCIPKPAQKTYPGCTIRNTPSEPVHCIVWSKHLFNQLFGEADPDEDVSPDTADPEAAGSAGVEALKSKATESGNVERESTRGWARKHQYNPKRLFSKLFSDDIRYLLTMDNLWKKRRAPTPLSWDDLPDKLAGCSSSSSNGHIPESGLRDQQQWTIAECRDVFSKAVDSLRMRLEKQTGDDAQLVWDKDDDDCMDFVTACSNIRSYIFGIKEKTRFEVKSMAGNIIPAIATTNAVIAGLIVMEALKILQDRLDDCRTSVLLQRPNVLKKLIVPSELVSPNPKCYVCSSKPQVCVQLNLETTAVKVLEDKILKSALHMVAPDVEVDDGKGTIIISSEEGETEEIRDKLLKDLNICDGAILKCDDFLQNYQLNVIIVHSEELPDGQEFIVAGDPDQLKKQAEEMTPSTSTAEEEKAGSSTGEEGPSILTVDDDEPMCLAEINEPEVVRRSLKRPSMAGNVDGETEPKKRKTEQLASS